MTKLKIAIIGSGLAGLSCGWLLSKNHEVTIFEKESSHGMDSHSIDIDVDGKTKRLDIPLRIFVKSFYPHLNKFYEHIGIQFNTENIDTSCIDQDGNQFLSYKNILIANKFSIPFVSIFQILFQPSLLFQYLNMIKLVWKMGKHISTDGTVLKKKTFRKYLEDEGFPESFIDSVIIPMLCLVCTCSYEALCNYPAEVIVDYCSKVFLRLGGVQKVTHGTQDVVQVLSKDCNMIFNAKVKSVTQVSASSPKDPSLCITHENGTVEYFHHVIFATPAHISKKLIQIDSPELYETLSKFKSEKSITIIHRDERLLPKNKDIWRSINLISCSPKSAPMASVWANRAHRNWSNLKENIFQTWNPLIEPEKDKFITSVELSRPIVDEESLQGLELLNTIQGQNNIWFVGSWTLWGVPLLENAARSGLDVAEKIGPALRPWNITVESLSFQNNFFSDSQIYAKYFAGFVALLTFVLYSFLIS